MGGVGGGHSKSSSENMSSSMSGLASQSMFTPLIAQMFGMDTYAGKGGFGIGQSDLAGDVDMQGNLSNQLFGPDTFASMGTIFDKVDSPEFDLGQMKGGVEQAFGMLQEGAQTGFADRINALNQNILMTDTLPQLQEQYGALGLNMGDSDMNRALAGALTRSSQQTSVDAISNMMQSSMGLADLVSGMGGIEQMFRDTARSRTGGQQALNQFLNLAGMNTQTGNVGESFSQGSSKSMSMNASVG
jgi:hypothetical protein